MMKSGLEFASRYSPAKKIAFVDVGGQHKGVINAIAMSNGDVMTRGDWFYHVLCPRVIGSDAYREPRVPGVTPEAFSDQSGEHLFWRFNSRVTACTHKMRDCSCLAGEFDESVPRFFAMRQGFYYLTGADLGRVRRMDMFHASLHIFPNSMEPTTFTTSGGVVYDCEFSIVDDHKHVKCTPRTAGKPVYEHPDYSEELRSGELTWDRVYGVRAGRVVGDTAVFDLFVLRDIASRAAVVPRKHIPTIDSWIARFGGDFATLGRDHTATLARISKEMDVSTPVAFEWVRIRLEVVRGLKIAELAAQDYVETPNDYMENVLISLSWIAVLVALFGILSWRYPFRTPLLIFGFFFVAPVCLVLAFVAFHFGRRFDRRTLVRKLRQVSPAGLLAFVLARTAGGGYSGVFWDGVAMFLPLFRPGAQSG